MKIACVTDDGETICPHFGRAQYYLVVTIEDGQVLDKELREKFGHRHVAASEGRGLESATGGHGTDPAAQSRHKMMADAIQDCQVLIAGGMGRGAFDSMQAAGIQTVVTDHAEIDQAVQAYIDESLDHLDDLVH